MNTRHVVAAALSSIVLAFIIKGYCILHLVDSTTDTTTHHSAESIKSFLYLASVLLALIVAPFICKFKSINKLK
jgi:hypothetical protein